MFTSSLIRTYLGGSEMCISKYKGICWRCRQLLYFTDPYDDCQCPHCNSYNIYSNAAERYIAILEDRKAENREKIAAKIKKSAEANIKTWFVICLNGIVESEKFVFYITAHKFAKDLIGVFEKIEIVKYEEKTIATEIAREVIRDAN